MTTQIAATPALKGAKAKKVYDESRKKPSKRSIEGAEELAAMFEPMMKR